jgi:RNA polymerase sigma-70 factor (ECF subfamily)
VASVAPAQGQSERELIAAARAGDHEAFERLTQPYKRQLHVHCYRMLGSFHDADDAVQETFLRAWRGLATFESRATFRAWLYRIATNACLREIERRPARVLPQEFGPAADPMLPPAPPVTEVVLLDPYPNALLGELTGAAADPEALYIERESVELAFLAVIQLLPPRQRAALLLRDVLGWRASEVAALLESSVASINSALQRARATLADRLHGAGAGAGGRANSDATERTVLVRYIRAWEEGDMKALALLLREDAVLTMAPAPNWFQGRQAIVTFFHELCFSARPKRFRLLPTGANGQPACAAYEWDADVGGYRFSGIMALRLEGDLISDITGFGDPELFSMFGLPAVIIEERPA